MTSNLTVKTNLTKRSILKSVVFYIVVVDKNNSDHAFLRHAINSVVPQAIVESVYNEEETEHYFKNCSSVPHLIFINQDMLHVSGQNTVDLIKGVKGLDKVPIIFLTNGQSDIKDLTNRGASSFYAAPYRITDLIDIVGDVNGKWLA
jgi:response regulator RpfG family c-di-GMP phosphodiesterase